MRDNHTEYDGTPTNEEPTETAAANKAAADEETERADETTTDAGPQPIEPPD